MIDEEGLAMELGSLDGDADSAAVSAPAAGGAPPAGAE
jgi:hypothetical protein